MRICNPAYRTMWILVTLGILIVGTAGSLCVGSPRAATYWLGAILTLMSLLVAALAVSMRKRGELRALQAATLSCLAIAGNMYILFQMLHATN